MDRWEMMGTFFISKALFMGDKSAVLSEIEVPNENITEQLERPGGGKSWGVGHPEAILKCGRGGILTRSTIHPE